MLLYTIKSKGFAMDAIDRIRNKFHRPTLALVAPPAKLDTSKLPVLNQRVAPVMPWTKLEYTKWIEGIKNNYKVGDLVTSIHIGVMTNTVPFHYSITYIEELHSHVQWDDHYHQPKCLHCKTLQGNQAELAPKYVRHLTEGEIALVNLSRSKHQGTA